MTISSILEKQPLHLWLQPCNLFQGIPAITLQAHLEKIGADPVFYPQNSFIAMEGDTCSHMHIILSGEIVVRKVYGSGKSVTITSMGPGDLFGELMVFTDHTLPSTIAAQTDVWLLQIPREDFIQLCQIEPSFLKNFIGLMADKVWMLNEKLKLLSYDSLRQKITSLLLDHYRKQQRLNLTLPFSRQEMADRVGVPRPSLSRELANMKKDGLIDYWKNHVRLLQLEALEGIMLD